MAWELGVIANEVATALAMSLQRLMKPQLGGSVVQHFVTLKAGQYRMSEPRS